MSTTVPDWAEEAEGAIPHGSLHRIALWSLLTILLGFGGLTAWAALTTIESAVPASGFIVSGGKRKTISLLESGILRTLLVREGETVSAGDVLMLLDDAQVRAVQSQASMQYWSAVVRAARLTAEAGDERIFPVSKQVRDAAAASPDIAATVRAEQGQFQERWRALDASVRVQERKIAQSEAQKGALRAQIAANGTRLALIRDELKGIDFLMERGLSTKPRQLELRRIEAELRGQLGALASQMLQTEQAIAQIELEILNTAATRHSDISRERTETQAAKADAEQRLEAATDLMRKKEVRAPEAGVVTDIRYFTPGSSIVAGQPVMDLVPVTETLLVEGSVSPHEVEHLAVGQSVNVRLTAYKAHRVPVLMGRLTYVGADRQMDASGQPYFLIRAAIDSDALTDKPGVNLSPGMPADILVINGARSALDFLISPISDSLRHGMKED